MKTTGIVSRVMAASSLLIGTFGDTASTTQSAAAAAQHVAGRLTFSGDAWAMVAIVAILLAYRLVRKHQALYPMTLARPGLPLRVRRNVAAEQSQSALTLSH